MTALETPMRCSALADELDEPMIGSVDQRVRWLLVEDRSAWGAKAVAEVLGTEMERDAKARGLRLLLVRRREGDPETDAVRRLLLADTATGEMAARTVGDLDEISLDAAEAPVADFGDPVGEPIFLVCTNGKRDACCALRGRALVAALAAEHPGRVWECSHLGGHRFAGNLVCLPDGIVYGRVTAADGPRLVAGYLEGRLDPAHLRGRSAWPAPAQVAELAVRRGTGLSGIGDVRLVSADVGPAEARVVLVTADGTTHRLTLRAERLAPPRPISCRADELEEPLHWRLA